MEVGKQGLHWPESLLVWGFRQGDSSWGELEFPSLGGIGWEIY